MTASLTKPSRPTAAALAAALATALAAGSEASHAAGVPTLDVVEVRAGSEQLIGEAGTASEGTVSARQIESRALMRPGEVLEVVPGLIITQHAGDGKANQYFLRGFNLDHGTDFSTQVNGVPVNLPTHAHGQGYLDLNFLIPELIERVRYRKGPYSVEEGDFAAAGAARIDYYRRLPSSFAEGGIGQGGDRRALIAGSPQLGGGHLLYGLEVHRNDGPWVVPEGFHKLNGVLRYSAGDANNGWSVTGMSYSARWTSTDQIAQRAIDAGLDRFGSLDPTSGGRTRRSSLSADWARSGADGRSAASAYVVDYRLNLFSNFTYFLDDLNGVGDQFEQADRRRVAGAAAQHSFFGTLAGKPSDTLVGAALRQDRIGQVGLFLTHARIRDTTIRDDKVTQRSLGLYVQNQTQWLDQLRTVLGWREDFYRVRVDSDTAANGGSARDHIGGPKATVVLGPWANTEIYGNLGHGFHSNDARGTTISVNPDPRCGASFGSNLDCDGNPLARVPLLVGARGAEIGLRSAPLKGLQTTLALWRLDVASELVFVGDAGTTEAGFPSRRRGVEFANFYRPNDWLTIDADLNLSRARFRDNPAGDFIPGAVERTVSVGVAVDGGGPWSGGLRLRHFGPRALVEDNTVRSTSSTLVNLRAGYRFDPMTQLTLDVLNLFDRKVNDIEYYYESKLTPVEAATSDTHLHPAEPRTLRLALRLRF